MANKKRKKGENTAPMDAALRYLSLKPRTVREVEDKLDSYDYAEYDVYATVERLKELGLLDDQKYAADFVETRLATRPQSRRKLREQLFAHRLPKEIIDEALAVVTDETEAQNALSVTRKFARQFEALDEEERRLRVMRRLVGRGYDIASSKAALELVFGVSDGLESCDAEDEDED